MIPSQITPHAFALAHYLNEYQRVKKSLVGAEQKQLQILRQTAIQKFSSLGFPTLKHPDWKYTSLVSFCQLPFSIASSDISPELAEIQEPASSDYRLVFINGFFSQALSKIAVAPNHAVIHHLADIMEHHPERLPSHWNDSATNEKNSFISLNTLFMQDGAYIYLPPHTKIVSPIELVFITSSEQGFTPIRNIIIVGEQSHATIIEKYISLPNTANCYFTNSVTECFLATQSHLEHYKLLEESENATHIGNITVEQQEKSQFSAYSLALTGALIRSDVQVKLCQPHAQCCLKGIYYARQHIDQRTLIDHASPETYSEEFYKGLIDENARGVFNGKLIIREKAIKSKAQQLNKNVLLSDTAEVYTKPQLEIFVDDIQCTHGASIGQLDEAAIFYLCTRGLSKQEARILLIKAFINDIVQPLLSTYPSLSYSLKNLLAFDYANI
jgi:Fe-S cluster assembly protein SufD